ncbi:MAG TPA: 23S rRNA (pseudouridine(1915)-N(3))-methyltransferase RlmH [Polyangiaceae bacterium]|nr:23S rRNA (pseudouridine(1915)-N(3))-methyltransferase RlmH [Polyangiaceae bacterium]
MKIFVFAVGKLKEPGYRALCDEYIGRIARYHKVDEQEVKSSADLARAFDKCSRVIACEVKGRSLTSEQFAKELERWGSAGKGDIGFLIGGAEGIPAELSKRTAAQLSLSSLTLPHRLARLVLLEQIYRAFSILRGEPYARE